MFFTVKNNYNWKPDYFKYKIISLARKRVLFYKLSAPELALNEYLLAKYNKPLKLICIALICATRIQIKDNEAIVLFKTTELDKLASLITYGNEQVQGSHILQVAFI